MTVCATKRGRSRARTSGIVPLHDAGLLPDGRLWYAMKLVRGRRLDRAPPCPTAELLRVFLRICEAVSFAHASGIVHCDLKPENVMLGDFGEVLVMDWAVARESGASDAIIGGTRGLMAPEQEQGATVDASTDVFAPRGDAPRERCHRTFRVRCAAICAKASAIEKADRYATVRDLANDIASWLDDRPVTAYRETVVERVGRWISRNRALVTIVLAYLVMRVIVILWVHR